MTLRPWPLRVSLLVAAGMAAATLLRWARSQTEYPLLSTQVID